MDSNLPPESGSPDSAPVPPAPAAPPPLTPRPPHRPPPVIGPTAANRPPRRSWGWPILCLILLFLLVASLVGHLKGAFSGMTSTRMGSERSGGTRLEEVVLKDNDASHKILVLTVDGVISGQAIEAGVPNMVTLIKEQLQRAADDHEVRAVLLKVDSPGGEVLASDDIARAISAFQEKSKKPVVVSMGSMAASGGYYISAPCRYIVANDLTITGSIGVIMHGYNYRGLLDKVGVRPEVYKSGKFKDMMSGTKSPDETLPEERQMVQSMINETFGKFKSVVREGRATAAAAAAKSSSGKVRPLSTDWEDYADGRILSGTEAYKLGFVDELGDFDKAVQRAKELGHVNKANLVSYQPVFDISNLFRLFGQSNAKGVKVDLGIEMPKLRQGCLYFLAPNYFL